MRGRRVQTQGTELITDRAAIRASTRSRSAGVMIAGHTAALITSPRCSRNPAIRPEHNTWRTARSATISPLQQRYRTR
jgi:hypothetical protein